MIVKDEEKTTTAISSTLTTTETQETSNNGEEIKVDKNIKHFISKLNNENFKFVIYFNPLFLTRNAE